PEPGGVAVSVGDDRPPRATTLPSCDAGDQRRGHRHHPPRTALLLAPLALEGRCRHLLPTTTGLRRRRRDRRLGGRPYGPPIDRARACWRKLRIRCVSRYHST